jgi:hypothetical protein
MLPRRIGLTRPGAQGQEHRPRLTRQGSQDQVRKATTTNPAPDPAPEAIRSTPADTRQPSGGEARRLAILQKTRTD